MIDFIIAAIIMLVLGPILIVYSPNIIKWMNKKSLLLFRIAPWLRFRKITDEEIIQEWNESILHYWELFFIWSFRLCGVIATGMAIYVLYVLTITE